MNDLLDLTLASLENQSSKNFEVLICGQDRPDLSKNYSFKIDFLKTPWEERPASEGPYSDKGRKVLILASEVRKKGGGYFMMLDADDLVHKKLVEFVYDCPNANGYIVERGYVLDYQGRSISDVPGTWPEPFHYYCGSCAVFNFDCKELPEDENTVPRSLFAKLGSHTRWKALMQSSGRPLVEVPFPAVIYVQNHGDNLHSSINASRPTKVLEVMNASGRSIDGTIAEDFGLSRSKLANYFFAR